VVEGGPCWFFGEWRYDGWGGDATNDMGDERGESDGEVIEPVLKQDMLGLVDKEDNRSGRVGNPREEEYGEECAGRVEHD
jgi:hypothetical protein